MMYSRISVAARQIAVFVVCVLLLSNCGSMKDEGYIIDVQQYRFQPNNDQEIGTLLESLTPMKKIGLPLLSKPDAPPAKWKQQRFFELITTYLPDEIQGESKIRELYFAVPCNYVESGPQALGIAFFRSGEYQGRQARLETDVRVDAQAGYLEAASGANFPADKPVVPVENISSKIPAETILALSEKARGEQVRGSMQDSCIIQGTLMDNMWVVFYKPLSPNNTEGFTLFFNATTGEPCSAQGCN